MKLTDIFKMELYKNRNDKTYLLIIGILILLTSLSTFFGIGLIEGVIDIKNSSIMSLMMLVLVFSVIGMWAFSLLYPFLFIIT